MNFQSNKKFFRDYFSSPLRLRRLRHRRRRCRFPRGRFVSRAFSMPSCVSPLSLMAPVSLLPLYFLHGASLSLTSSLSHLFLTARLALALSYRCRFPVSFTRLISRYLLRLPSRPRSDLLPPSYPLSLPPFYLASLICSAKFPEKAMISSA